MSHRWAALGTAQDGRRVADFKERAARCWSDVLARVPGDPVLAARLAGGLSPALSLMPFEKRWLIRCLDLTVWPLAETLAESAPANTEVILGLPPQGYQAALREVRHRWRVDLAASQVRVGVTRGHLLLVVLAVPLEVELGAAELDDAAQTFAEHCLGDRALDRWVASIDVVRLPRRGSLALVQESASAAAETYPLEHLEALMRTGIAAILAEQPHSRLSPTGAEWAALEMLPSDQGPQADRCQAFTSCPEALKAALEGLPFDSGRFTKGREVFAWLRWSAGEMKTRPSTKFGAECALDRAAERGLPAQLAGTGFGGKTDYIDLWVNPTESAIADVLALLRGAVQVPVDFGFYDTVWTAEVLHAG